MLLALAAFGLAVEAASAAIIPPSSELYTITLGWDAVPETNIQGYRIFVGSESEQYTRSHDTGPEITFPVPDLEAGQTYYFAVRAISTTGVESVNSQELVVTVIPQPVAMADSYSTSQDTPLVVEGAGVLANDTDMDSETLTAVLNDGPQHGSLALNPEGGFTYTPAANYFGADSFSYHATDGALESDVVEVSINVNLAHAQLIVNGSFESDFAAWTVTGNPAIAVAAPYAATDGAQLVAFNAANQTPDGVLSQTFPTVPGETYTLEFDTGVLAYNSSTQDLRIEVAGESSLLAQQVSLSGYGANPIRWEHRLYTFVADSSSSTLTFRDQSADTFSIDLLLDNVSVTGAVLKVSNLPEEPEVPEQPAGPALAGTPALTGSPGNFTVSMQAQQPGSYVLERSEDLVVWEVVETKEITESGLLEFHDSAESVLPDSPPAKTFYRIGLKISDPAN